LLSFTKLLARILIDLFFETIKELKEKKTFLLIAHKLDDYTGFDSVYELRTGNLFKLA